MFGPEPAFVTLTLEAALRDATAKRAQARANAMHSLGTVVLAERQAGGSEPREQLWRAAEQLPRRDDILARLREGTGDEDAQVRGLALVSMGRIGAPGLYELAIEALARPGEDPPDLFVRECALIGLSHLGEAADGHDQAIHERVLRELDRRLRDGPPDVRFQAAPALARVGGHGQIPTLLEALEREEHPEVREHLVIALRMLEAADETTCNAMLLLLDEVGVDIEAALVLAGAGRSEGASVLTEALRLTERRDDALEALAALAPDELAEPTVSAVRRLARGWFTPAITRVRAAYALARMRPAEGLPLLDDLGRHPRPAVREAVRDAHAALAQLEARLSARELE